MNMFKEQTCLQFLFYSKDGKDGKDGLLKRISKAQLKTKPGDLEMGLWESFLRLCFTLMSHHTEFNWSEFPDPALYEKSWSNTPSLIIPLVQDECFPKIPRKSRLLPLLPPLLLLLKLRKLVPKMETFVSDLYFGIAVDEYKQTNKFQDSASKSCETIDAAMTEQREKQKNVRAKPDDTEEAAIDAATFQHFFNDDIAERFKKVREPLMKKAGLEFIQEVLDLLQLEMEYDAIPDEGERASVTMKIMNSLMSFEREMSRYYRYVHILYQLHLRKDSNTGELVSYAEAGTTILLHANRLGWTDELLPELELQNNEPPLPAEPSWARKQRLYYLAIDAFNNAKLQERSIDLLKELEKFHMMRRDFGQLAKILNDQKDAYCGIKEPSRDSLSII